MPTFNLEEEIKKRLGNSWIYKSEYLEFSKTSLIHALEDLHHDLKNSIFGEEEPEEDTSVAREIEEFIDELNELQKPIEEFEGSKEIIDIDSLVVILVKECNVARKWAEEKKVDFGGLDFYLGLERMINKRRNEIREREREVGLETEARQGSEGGENEAKMISSSKFPKK
ncbi:MAG: hypothetical protein HQ530_02320 [Parcubacteria group bacterium]|nr:hypothetical protein [Parcubacteria group bacterium]